MPADFIFRRLHSGNKLKLHPPVAPGGGDCQAVVVDQRGEIVAEAGENPVDVEVPARPDTDSRNRPSFVFCIVKDHHGLRRHTGLTPAEPQRSGKNACHYAENFNKWQPGASGVSEPTDAEFDGQHGHDNCHRRGVGDHPQTISTVTRSE